MDVLEILGNQVRGFGNVFAVERRSDWQEPVHEADLPLGVGNPGLVKASGGLGFPELRVETTQ